MGWLNIIGAAFTIIGGSKAKRASKQAAAAEARMEGLVTAEKLRQMTYEEQVERSSIIAQYSASGADVNVGSPLNVLAEQAAEYRALRAGVSRAGATRSANARLRGKLQGETAQWNALSSAFSQAGQGIASYIG